MKTDLIKDYQLFEGSYNSEMSKLIKSGLQSLTAKDVMQYRMKAHQSNHTDNINFWLNKPWDTISGLVYYEGNLIIQPDSQFSIDITQKSILTPYQFKKLSQKYEVLQRNEIIHGRPLNEREAKENPILIELAEGDKVTLNEYVEAIFSRAKTVYNYDKNIGIYLPNDLENPAIHAWSFRNLYEGSSVDARAGLFSKSRLLGMRA